MLSVSDRNAISIIYDSHIRGARQMLKTAHLPRGPKRGTVQAPFWTSGRKTTSSALIKSLFHLPFWAAFAFAEDQLAVGVTEIASEVLVASFVSPPYTAVSECATVVVNLVLNVVCPFEAEVSVPVPSEVVPS